MPAYALLDISELTWESTTITRIHRTPGFKIKVWFAYWETPWMKDRKKKSPFVQRNCRVGTKHFQQSVFISLEGACLIRLHLLLDTAIVKIRGFFKKKKKKHANTEQCNFTTERNISLKNHSMSFIGAANHVKKEVNFFCAISKYIKGICFKRLGSFFTLPRRWNLRC